jgi:hypothetical protein
VPGPGLAHAQFGDERVHFGVELNHHLVGVVAVAGQIVARRVPRGAPELFDAGRAQRVGRDGVVRIPPELEGDMVDPRFGVKTRKCTNCPARVNDARTGYFGAVSLLFWDRALGRAQSCRL